MPEDNRLPDPAREEPPKERSGEYLLRVLKPGGAVAVLLLMALFLVICFTHKSDPVLDYVPPHTSEYYALHMDELEQELRRGLLPYLPPCTLSDSGEFLTVTAEEPALETIRGALTAHYDAALFRFEEAT